uniref:Chromosome 2 open reading frame 76 n=1 Tax=Amphiprion percula TaxID=161767 RepID=A0A3P8UD42_AMPPE
MDGEAVVTVRLVRSFEHRNFKPVVFHGVSLDQTVQDFIEFVRGDIATKPGLPPPFRKYAYGMYVCLDFHQSWTNELVMSLDDDDKLILQDDQTLRTAGVANETEVAFFREEDYRLYRANPKTAW